MTFFNLGDLIIYPALYIIQVYQAWIYLTIIVFHQCALDMRWYRAVAKISSCWVYAVSIVGGELYRKEVLLVLFSFCFL